MASYRHCPIPSDPGYEHKAGFSSSQTNELSPLSRVRPEAVEIARLATAGTIANLLSNSCSLPPSSSRKQRAPPKDHLRANWKRIQEIAYLRKQKEQNEVVTPVPLAAHNKQDRYRNVPSRVECFRRGPQSVASQPSSLPEHSIQPLVATATKQLPRGAERLQQSHSVSPQAQSEPVIDVIQPKTRRNFIAENAHCATNSRSKKPPRLEQQENDLQKQAARYDSYQRGSVPKYLRDRQERWKKEEEERIANLPDPSIPPGHILMASKDQQHTLEILEQHQKEYTRQLQSLSITSDALLVRNQRAELESKLSELEDAIKIFSRPKVFIKMD